MWEAQSFDSPLGAHLYNRTFQPFDIKTILTADLELDQVAFAAVQPVLLTPFFACALPFPRLPDRTVTCASSRHARLIA